LSLGRIAVYGSIGIDWSLRAIVDAAAWGFAMRSLAGERKEDQKKLPD